MTPSANKRKTIGDRGASLRAMLLAGALVLGWPALPGAQTPAPLTKPLAKVAAVEQGKRWSELKPAQQVSLKPLEREWSAIDVRSKQKWLELSTKFPNLTPAEQVRVQERMREWAKLSPRERTNARMHFQEAKQLPAQDRQARWKAYEALTPEQKQQLVVKPSVAAAPDTTRKAGAASVGSDKPPPQAKSNIVPNPAFSAPPKSVAPTVVQARPGATTTLITKRPAPPGHQQTGMPKIAATPEFVNKATLLPQRGPQGAATRSASVPAGEPAGQ